MSKPDLDEIIDGIMQDDTIKDPCVYEKLPEVPVFYNSTYRDDSEFIKIMYENGSISYINLRTIPVIQRTIKDELILMWPDASNGIYLKPLYVFNKVDDPVSYEKIETFLGNQG